MIPSWNHSGVLPPFVGANPAGPAAASPYWTTTEELAKRFAGSPVRRVIFQGLLKYRRALVGVGIRDAFQWVDGSFVEDVERTQSRNPGDVDLVTFGFLPKNVATPAQKQAFLANHLDLLEPARAQASFHCHAFFVDLAQAPKGVVDKARYWSNLFSHRRTTYLWKGMVALDLAADDSAAWHLVS